MEQNIKNEQKLEYYNIFNVTVGKIKDHIIEHHDMYRMANDGFNLWCEVKGDNDKVDKSIIKYAKISENGMFRPFEPYNKHIQSRNSHQFGKKEFYRYLIDDNINWIYEVTSEDMKDKLYELNYGGPKRGQYFIMIRQYNTVFCPFHYKG